MNNFKITNFDLFLVFSDLHLEPCLYFFMRLYGLVLT